MTDYEMNEYEGIQIERTEGFTQKAKQLSDFVAALPLDTQTNDRLVELMVEQVKEAELGAFAQGLRIGHEYSEYEASHPEEEPVSTGNLPS